MPDNIDVVILCGGMGTRLKSVVSDRPKPMAEINGKPFLHYLLKQISDNGFKHVILCVGYKAEIIKNYFKDKYFNLDIQYSIETEPLGTGGAVRLALSKVNSDYIIIMNGDSYIDVDLDDFVKNSILRKTEANILINEMDNVARYGRVVLDNDNMVISFEEKGTYKGKGYINSGVYFFKTSVLKTIPINIKYSIETELFPEFIKEKLLYSTKQFTDIFIDIGTPMSYRKAGELL